MPVIETTREVRECVCRFCGYRWQPRVEIPKACPDCKKRNPL